MFRQIWVLKDAKKPVFKRLRVISMCIMKHTIQKRGEYLVELCIKVDETGKKR